MLPLVEEVRVGSKVPQAGKTEGDASRERLGGRLERETQGVQASSRGIREQRGRRDVHDHF
jgi:hypothetical protein